MSRETHDPMLTPIISTLEKWGMVYKRERREATREGKFLIELTFDIYGSDSFEALMKNNPRLSSMFSRDGNRSKFTIGWNSKSLDKVGAKYMDAMRTVHKHLSIGRNLI